MNRFAFAPAALAAMALAAPASAADENNRVVTIANLSTQAVREVYASPSDHDTWEEDLLGNRMLPSAESMRFDIDNGTDECIYDLKAVLENDEQYVRTEVDVCAVATWVIGDAADLLL